MHKALNLRGGNKVKTNLVVVVVVPGFTYRYGGENRSLLVLLKTDRFLYKIQFLKFGEKQKNRAVFSDLLINFF
jgi:hypothetical protein